MKNGFVNIGLPFFGFSEPLAPPTHKYNDKSFTLWDKIIVDKNLTLKQLLEHLKTKEGLEVTMLSCDVSLVYSFFMKKDKLNEKLNVKMCDLVKGQVLEICANDLQGEDIEELPSIYLQ